MRCRTAERLISGFLDSKLSAGPAGDLEVHLAGCPSCRSYLAGLDLIQRGASVSEETSVPSGYWDDLSARVRARLEPASAGAPPRFFPLRGWRWAWLAVPAAAAVLLVFIQVFRPAPVSDKDPINQERRLAAAGLAALEDPELAGELDDLVLAAIQEETGFLSLDELPPLADDPGFWDGLTDAEVSLIDEEIAKELIS
jgi:anti-sigma factor RsiW